MADGASEGTPHDRSFGVTRRPNRRNYYRILHVQPDAPPEILRSSYRALMHHLEVHPDRGGDHWNASLVNEAYDVLSDPHRRAEYDETIDVTRVGRGPARRGSDEPVREAAPSAPDPAAPPRRPPTPGEGYGRSANVHEVEHAECLFCGSGWAMTLTEPTSVVCARCRSPLTVAGARVLDDPGRRAARRIEREGAIVYYEQWPQDVARSGRIVDLSPMGMQFVAAKALDEFHIVKIEGRLLDAVASVANCRRIEPLDEDGAVGFAVGVQFHTVRFNQARGTFLSTEA